MKRTATIAALAACALLGLAGECLASAGAGAINLQFPIGGRYAAMGEAGSALSQDATAMWWNPGGLAFLQERSRPHDVHLMQSSLAAGLASDIGLYWGGYAAPWASGVVGMSINYLDMGDQEGMDEAGRSTGTFGSYMVALGANYGFKLHNNLGAGLGIKYFHDRLAPDSATKEGTGGSASSFGIDLGMLWKAPFLKLNVGAAVSNIGPDIKHVDENQSDPMPRRLSLGLAYSVFSTEYSSLLTVFDYMVPLLKWDESSEDYGYGLETADEEIGYGLEWSYIHSLFLRLGYKKASYAQIEDMTWGFGVDLTRWLGQSVAFDYASVPQAEGLDKVNRLSLSYRF